MTDDQANVIELPRRRRGESSPQPRLLLRIEEVADMLGIGRSTVFEMVAAGELPVVRIRRATRIPRDQLEEWIRERTEWGCVA